MVRTLQNFNFRGQLRELIAATLYGAAREVRRVRTDPSVGQPMTSPSTIIPPRAGVSLQKVQVGKAVQETAVPSEHHR